MIAFRPGLDLAAAGAGLRSDGRAQIRDILQSTAAEQLATRLAAMDHWDLALTRRDGPIRISDAEFRAMSAADRARMTEELRRQARTGFSFAYYRRDVEPADDAPTLPEFRDWIRSDAFLDGMRLLTGDDGLVRADAHATLYRPGSYLKSHDDTYSGKQRRFAYVMNFSRKWQADWGGLLHFEAGSGEIEASFLPRFNSLSIFRVPQGHFVSQVATYATEPRLAVTGWLFA